MLKISIKHEKTKQQNKQKNIKQAVILDFQFLFFFFFFLHTFPFLFPLYKSVWILITVYFPVLAKL